MDIPVIGNLIGRFLDHSHPSAPRVQEEAALPETTRRQPVGPDTVELSSHAPRPLDASDLRDAEAIADKLRSGESLSIRETNRLRQDRIFAALAVLVAASGQDGTTPSWPGGLPAPTAEELGAAYRRLSQRLRNLDTLRDPEEMQQLRRDVLDDLRGVDLSAIENDLIGDG